VGMGVFKLYVNRVGYRWYKFIYNSYVHFVLYLRQNVKLRHHTVSVVFCWG